MFAGMEISVLGVDGVMSYSVTHEKDLLRFLEEKGLDSVKLKARIRNFIQVHIIRHPHIATVQSVRLWAG